MFICESRFAAGSITVSRDVNNQAVFVLKRKLLNLWGLKRDVMFWPGSDLRNWFSRNQIAIASLIQTIARSDF